MWLWLAVTFTSVLALASLLWWQLAIFYQRQKFAAQLKIFLASAYRQLDFKQLLVQVAAFVKQSFGSGSCVLIGNFLDEATFSSSECAGFYRFDQCDRRHQKKAWNSDANQRLQD